MVSGLFRHLCPQFILVLVHARLKKMYLFTLFLKKTALGHLVFLMPKFFRPGLIYIASFWLVNFKQILKITLKYKCLQITTGKPLIVQVLSNALAVSEKPWN